MSLLHILISEERMLNSFPLSNLVKSLVVSIEAFAGINIKVKLNPYPINNSDPNPNAPSAHFSFIEAVIYIRNWNNFEEQGILHLLLILKRYWIDKVPQIIPTDKTIERFRITSEIEVALERLVVVPLEINYGFDPYSYWNITARKNWDKYPLIDVDPWVRRKNFLLGSLTVANLVTDDGVRNLVRGYLLQEGLLSICNKLNEEIKFNLGSKERCLSIIIRYLNIEEKDVQLLYLDVKNRKQEELQMP